MADKGGSRSKAARAYGKTDERKDLSRVARRQQDKAEANELERDLVAMKVEQAKREITVDVLRGIVPAGVESFSELHDYVDANEYGDVTVVTGPAVQDELDAWIKAGGVADYVERSDRGEVL